jgi:DNA-binding NarL/FixJ family response regulator
MSGRMIRLMLVDDHQMFVQSLARVLELEEDIEVVATANSVSAGISAAAEHLPDVILMDYRLPDGDGISAASRIGTDHPHIKIVLLAGSNDPNALRRVVDAGCLGYLDKARSIDDVLAAVRIAATGHVVISASDLARIVAGTRDDVTSLTKREREILFLIAEGLSNEVIARRLVLSVHTVRTHVQTILAKLGAHSKLEALAIAKRRTLVG